MISIPKGLAAAFLLASVGHANAVTWQISGDMVYQLDSNAPQALRDLEGTSFTTYLTYNETALPTSMLSPEFYNYANEGSISVHTISGTVSARLLNLQTFIKETPEGQGSNFNGASFAAVLAGQLSPLESSFVSMDFQFQQTPWGSGAGLTSFALPGKLNIADFDGGNFIRLTFDSESDQHQTVSILGKISDVSPVPELQTYMMLAGGLLLLGWKARRRRNS